MDSKISETQLGFRPKRSTAQATYLIRRLQDWSEQKGADLFLALVDWEKAFDKVQHCKLFDSMYRLGLSNHFINAVRTIYRTPTFFVQDDYGKSELKTQLTGIRQGCPLSPYLFLLVMTCVESDMKERCSGHVTNSRVPGVNFDVVFYADDTILFSTKPRGLNELLKHIEICSENYGLKLNRGKCHTLNMHRRVPIHFSDDTPLHDVHDATYLGNNLNHTVNLSREVSQRIQDTKRTWKKLNLFWNEPSANRKWKLLIYDAVIKSKLLYNLETVHLTRSLRQKLDAFHLRGLRKILKLPTTYVDRRFSNARVYEIATHAQYSDKIDKRVRPISEELDEKRIRLTGHIIRSDSVRCPTNLEALLR